MKVDATRSSKRCQNFRVRCEALPFTNWPSCTSPISPSYLLTLGPCPRESQNEMGRRTLPGLAVGLVEVGVCHINRMTGALFVPCSWEDPSRDRTGPKSPRVAYDNPDIQGSQDIYSQWKSSELIAAPDLEITGFQRFSHPGKRRHSCAMLPTDQTPGPSLSCATTASPVGSGRDRISATPLSSAASSIR